MEPDGTPNAVSRSSVGGPRANAARLQHRIERSYYSSEGSARSEYASGDEGPRVRLENCHVRETSPKARNATNGRQQACAAYLAVVRPWAEKVDKLVNRPFLMGST